MIAGDQLPATAAEALAELVAVREEKRAAAHVLALIQLGRPEEPAAAAAEAPLTVLRRAIELDVAERRLSLWADRARRLENRLRSLGVRP